MAKNKHIGSRFDELLAEDGQLESATAVAGNSSRMKSSGADHRAMTERMHTSRAASSRLLDDKRHRRHPRTLKRGAQTLGYRVKVELVGT